MGSAAGRWWLPGIVVGSVGVLAFVAGFATGGPDTAGGVVFGAVALAAAAVILWRRAPKSGDPGSSGDADPGAAPDRDRTAGPGG
jgi:hypothetical protein